MQLLQPGETPASESVSLVFGETTLYLLLSEMVDREAERNRLNREIERLKEMESRARSMLANEQFVSRARPDVVQQQRDKLQSALEGLSQLEEELAKLN